MSDLNRVFSQTARLPHLPEVVFELDRVTRDDDSDLRRIAAVIAKDQAVAAKALRLANSAFYGSKGKIDTLESAVRVLGIRDFRVLVLASSAMAAVGQVPGVDMQSHWMHSAIAGQVASAISSLRGQDDASAFASGLLHSMGVLLLHLTLPDEAGKVSSAVSPLDMPARAGLERELLGFDHAQVGGELLRRWNLPPSISGAVRDYIPRLDLPAAAPSVIYCSSVSATGAIRGDGMDALVEAIGVDALGSLGVEKDWLAQALERSAGQAEVLVAAIG